MKKTTSLFIIIGICIVQQSFAQVIDTTVAKPAKTYASGRNIIKMNLSSLLLNNYSFTYERGIGKKTSLSVNYRFMPNGELPYQSEIQSIIKDNSIDFSTYKLGGYAITPEFRLYSHKNMRGFYLALYGRYSNFDMTVPIKYTYTTPTGSSSKSAVFTGSVSAMSGGIMIGTQHNIFKNCVIDIWIIGAHFGNCQSKNLKATFTPALSGTAPAPGYDSEQTALQKKLNSIDASPFKVTGTVDNSGNFATLDASGPWLGVRGLGINFGIRF
ncbi:MAG: DUF3575 domain-containing protein [Bacteroidetes bacterium]|nr:DUF3575 domain-containing protein [Bacteroidota bacterium]MBS1648788.1 DUF3575 domain-containing protein [Bacteroidota bacterium]